jgi:capsular exopolysaccharide synthesis family protein
LTASSVFPFARRWLWLLALAPALAALASLLVSLRLPPVYEGTAKLLVTPAQSPGGVASYNDVLTAERLTRTYAEVLKTRPVVEAAVRQVGLDLPYEQALARLEVKPLRETQLVQVSARAPEPGQAAQLANTLAAVFIQQTQATQSGRFAASRESLARQVEGLAAELAERARQIDHLRAAESSASRDGQLARLQGELAQLQQSHATAVRSYEDVRVAEARGSDLLALVEPAAAPAGPVSPRVALNVLLAGGLGLGLGLGLALALERLDDRLLSAARLRRFAGLEALASVAVLPPDAPRTVDRVPASPPTGTGTGLEAAHAAEAYRLLRANLQFAALERPLRTLLVTSAAAGDGKSTTAANLAVVLAQAGQRVLLVDADLRRPTQHQVFGLPNRSGLTTLLLEEERPAASVCLRTRVAGLSVLPSGALPPNPGELLGSARMRRRLAELRELADVVVIDSPPTLPVSDPALLAGQADGTLLVVNAQRTRGQQAAQAVATLQQAGATLMGAVLNRAKREGGAYYGYYTSQAGEAAPAPSAA